MKTSILAGSLLASLALVAAPLEGQAVSAEVVIRSGSSSYRHPHRVVVVERDAPRIIVVERMLRGHGKHWRRHGYHPVVLYFVGGRYYDRLPRRRARAQEIVVYERGGRYYREYDYGAHRGWSHDRHNHDRND